MIVYQGDLVTLGLSSSVGHETASRRPAVVVSSDKFNQHTSLIVVVPISTADNGFPMHVPLPDECLVHGWACVEQMSTLDPNARDVRALGESLDVDTMDDILSLIKTFF